MYAKENGYVNQKDVFECIDNIDLNEDEIDFGCRMGVGFNKKHLYINCGYDISGNYGVGEDAFFVSVGYNF